MFVKLLSIELLLLDEYEKDNAKLSEDDDMLDISDYYMCWTGPFGDFYNQRRTLESMIPEGTVIPMNFDASCSFIITVLDVLRNRTVDIHVYDTVFPNRRTDIWENGGISTHIVPETLFDVAVLVQKYRKRIEQSVSS